jgi:hypothetical protein
MMPTENNNAVAKNGGIMNAEKMETAESLPSHVDPEPGLGLHL